MSIPHLRIPLALGARGAATVDQDSDEELVQSVATILRTRPGEVRMRPDFGLADGTFALAREEDQGIVDAVDRFDPRVTVAVVQAAIAQLRVEVDT